MKMFAPLCICISIHSILAGVYCEIPNEHRAAFTELVTFSCAETALFGGNVLFLPQAPFPQKQQFNNTNVLFWCVY